MITIKTTQDLKNAKLADLVEFYNHNADKPVKRFSDRKAAERRVAKLIEDNTGKKLGSKTDHATKTGRTQAEGITESWTDKAIREARSSRIHILVDDEPYTSVRKAFEALDLPMNEHIPFRGKLREAGRLEAYDMTWEVSEIIPPKAK